MYFKAGHQNRGRKYKMLPELDGQNYCGCGCGVEIAWYGARGKRKFYKLGHRKEATNTFQKGFQHPRWKGGGVIGSDSGYRYVKAANHPRMSNGCVREHVLVMEDYLSRHLGFKVYLDKDWDIHHKNKIKTDNRTENLELMTFRDHYLHHLIEKRIGEPLEVKSTYSRLS